MVTLPCRDRDVEEFAKHMASDAKMLEEDEETGARRYKYIRTGPDHYSLAFTYAWMAGENMPWGEPRVAVGPVPLHRQEWEW